MWASSMYDVVVSRCVHFSVQVCEVCVLVITNTILHLCPICGSAKVKYDVIISNIQGV